MNIDKIVGFLQNLNTVTFNSELCSKLISPKSSCTNCTKVCPVQGITFTARGLEVQNCTSCGLCIEACPNHVFILSENQLIEMANSDSQTLILTCPSLYETIPEELAQSVTKLSCLGELYPELTFYLLASFKKVILIHDTNKCAECFNQDIKEKIKPSQFSHLQDKYFTNKLLVVNDFHEIKPYLKNQKAQQTPDRRAFFRHIFQGSKNISKEILQSALNQEKLKKGGSIPPKRQYLKVALQKQENLDLSDTLPYPKLRIMACNFCGACSKLCPTHALKLQENENEKIISFTPNLCTQCNICSEICYYQGLTWEENIIIKEFLNDNSEILATGQKRACNNCEQDFYELDEKEELCFLCRPKRSINGQED
jgi:ferredoxin